MSYLEKKMRVQSQLLGVLDVEIFIMGKRRELQEELQVLDDKIKELGEQTEG